MTKENDHISVLTATAVLSNGHGGWQLCPEVLTPQEAALYLRLDLNGNWGQTLRYYRERKKLKGTRIGKRVFYTRKALNEFLDLMTQ